ncbi:dynactin, dynein-associated polypeptide ro-3 [Grosmannia clavigera kw1407]|uniref:Dynactin, dynein-associated polypeptide ro-3 n=1 Tax=Grosmannia clavigera (strain kw1407 / UAMH 11150) TaxID=655863 RepID=F0XD57_GROCL|nr:dynactin, dynein-associated polypeptide ro-3 [Grosmannia clavigera kw1407]EFX03639.1 dynactin, dynein-associated polypeptide ro-3 [Grosmannia clavigera kw1407]
MEVAVGQVILLGDGRRGTIRFVGQTLFAPGDWVGVELETTTGKNNGSVQGERYFDCAMGRGMFLRPSAVTIVAVASDADDDDEGTDDAHEGEETQTAVQVPKSVSAARHSSADEHERAQSQPAATISADEHYEAHPRMRSSSRAASGEFGGESSGGGVVARAAQVRRARTSMDGRITSPPKSSDEEVLSPQPRSPVRTRAAALEKLTGSGAGATPRHRAAAPVGGSTAGATGSPASASASAAAAVAAAGTGRPTTTNAAAHREVEDLKAKLRVLERKRLEDRDKLKQLDKLQADCDKYQGIIQKIQAKYQPQQQENAELRRQLKEAETRMESIETLQADHDTAMELSTLDREMAEETAEVYKAELDAVKLKNEELEVEMEELRLENAEMSEGMTAEEKASAGWLQMERNNERLRSALLRLRDMTQQQESELQDQIKGLEEEVTELSGIKARQAATAARLEQSEAAVEDLRQQLDAAQAADDMMMELTERNMSQAEQMEELKAVISDLESLKEINDELEINHVQNERELQEEIDFKAAVIQEQARRAAQQEEALEDMEYALSRFRQMVTGLQSDLEDMRASHAVTENESEQLSSKSRAMMDLNLKLQLSAAKAQVKTIDLELRRMEAQEAEQHLAIVRLFLPETYVETDGKAVLALLRFRRLAFKAELVGGFVRERIGQQGGGGEAAGREDDVLAGCEVVDKLTWVAAMCTRFAGAMGRCSTERFGRFEGALFELEPVERALNGWIDGLRRDELKEQTCAAELQRTMALLSHLASVHMEEGQGQQQEDVAEGMHMRAVLVQSHLETAAATLHVTRGMVQRAVPPRGSEDEAAQEFAQRAEAAIAQTRSAKVVAGKMVRALEELQTRSLALEPEMAEAFAQCEAAAGELATLARKTGEAVMEVVTREGGHRRDETGEQQHDDEEQHDSSGPTYGDMQKVVAAAEGETASDSGELFGGYIGRLRAVATQVAELAGLSSDLSQTVEFERAAAPWVVRSQEMRAPKTVAVDAEEELRRLREEHAEARRMIARRDNDLGTAQLKIETLESKMRDAQHKAAVMAELERTVAAEQAFGRQLKEDVQKQDRELKALEAERDRWRKMASEVRLLGGGEGEEEEEGMEGMEGLEGGEGLERDIGHGHRANTRLTQRNKERAAATAREMDGLRHEIAGLQAAVRFLREDSRRARMAEQPVYGWLAEPLSSRGGATSTATRTATKAARRARVAAEARDVLGELVRMAADARVYDLEAELPEDRLAWRPAHTSPGYQAARMAEDYAAWRAWEAAVVRKAQDVLLEGGGSRHNAQAQTPDERTARRLAHRAATVRLQQTRLPAGEVDKTDADGQVRIASC